MGLRTYQRLCDEIEAATKQAFWTMWARHQRRLRRLPRWLRLQI